MNANAESHPILLFDGECNLCNHWVQFVLDKEREPQIRFAALQSETGQTILKQHGLPTNTLDSLVFVMNGKTFLKSTGALRLTAFLRRPWSFAQAGLWVPRFVRDFAYNVVAANRYRIFGKSAQCLVPDGATRERFLS